MIGFTEIIFTVFGCLLMAFCFALGMRYENHLMMRRLKELVETVDIVPCCGNCSHYDGDHCMKDWNNLDKDYYIPDRDDKEPECVCDDWELDEMSLE